MPPSLNAQGPAGSRPVPLYRDLVLLQMGALVLVIDQFTKFLVRQLLEFRESFPAEGFVRITHTYNTGTAFGVFQGQNTPLILLSLVGITVLALIYRSQSRPGGLLRLSLGLQLGGAAGNLLDRVRLGRVTDFIDVGSWPVFNLADASIVVGLALLAWLFLGPGRAAGRLPAAQGVAGAGAPSQGQAISWCPMCDGDMVPLSDGWRCSGCGVRERIDLAAAQPGGGMAEGAPGPDGYAWCPICDGEMVPVLDRWRCTSCGAGEEVDRPVAIHLPATTDGMVSTDGLLRCPACGVGMAPVPGGGRDTGDVASSDQAPG